MFSAPIPDNDQARLATLRRYAILDTAPEEGYEDVTALASHICDAPFSTITFVDQHRQWFKAERGFGAIETNRSDGFCAWALLKPDILIIEDALLDARFAENPFVLGGPQIRSYAGAPLISPNGHILGTVCVFDTQPRVLSAAQTGSLAALSRQVMALLESRLRLAENQKAVAALMQSEKLAAVGRLASSMAHEINNPLESITNLLYLARQQARNPEVQTWLDQAEVELRRISVIANQALRFHKQASRPQAVTCMSLFSSTLNLYESRLHNAQIKVVTQKRLDEPIVCFEGDIRQVLSNLITNAIDAMPTGGRLTARGRRGTDWTTGRKGLVLTIADTGTGIDDATQKRMFEAFFSTKGIGGSGLGLWMSADIMHRHQGKIRVKSRQREPGKGTVVSLFLPSCKAEATTAAPPEIPPAVPATGTFVAC